MDNSPLRLFVSVPVAGFRVGYAREYWETYPCPPPSTVYGMLLSLVGESNRLVHQGAEIALALVSTPARSVVLRTLWRVKEKNLCVDPSGNQHVVPNKKKEREKFKKWYKERFGEEPKFKVGLGLGANVRPDFQELLTDIRLSVWVKRGKKEGGGALVERLEQSFEEPAAVLRFGALSLGESTHMVDEIRPWRDNEDPQAGRLLVRDTKGNLTLPVWPDHVGAKGTRWEQFELRQMNVLSDTPEENSWVSITPPW